MNSFDYLVADRLDAALAEYAADDKIALKAGGVDLLDLMKEGIESPQTVLSIHRLEELSFIREADDGLHLGALTTLDELARNDIIRERYTALHQSAAGTATPQVRRRATLAGNLCQRPRCWYYRNIEFNCLKKTGATCYAIDGENQYHAIFGGGPCHIVHPSNIAPALVALGATLVIRSAAGANAGAQPPAAAGQDGQGRPSHVPAERFFLLPRQSMYAENALQPGQIITEIILPHRPRQSATVELREKQSFDWPLASASVARLDDGWRVCLGAVAPVPWLSGPAMAALGAGEITADLAAAAGEAAAGEAQPLRDNVYKVQLVKVVTRRALLAAAAMEVSS